MSNSPDSNTHGMVQRYYGETLESSEDLKTTACCTAVAPSEQLKQMLADIHDEVASRYYGCGLVLPEVLDGLRVLDLGCGAGRDVYLLSRMVGAAGHVTGVDMTPEQLDVARRHQDYHARQYGYDGSNVDFVAANIEELDATDLPDASFDLIVSNCVINLAVDKAAVLRSAYRLLQPGGEMYFSDIYVDRRVPDALKSDPVLYGECLAGALYWNDFVELARECGFAEPLLVEEEALEVTDSDLAAKLGDLRFRSVTIRLFRVPELEAGSENYGQRVVYKGGIPEQEERFVLAVSSIFQRGKNTAISGNMSCLLKNSRFAPYFEHIDGEGVHLGAFSGTNCGPDFSDTAKPAKSGSCC